MNTSLILTIIKNVIDICLVWIMIYYVLKNIKNNVKMTMLFKGLIILLVVKVLADLLNLFTIGLLLEYVIMWGPLALIIIFQPEIRNTLEQLGRTQLLGRHKTLSVSERERIVSELINSLEYMKKNRIGALIVIERDYSLREYIDRSKKIYADVSSELIESIFFPNNPLHDGGVIIQGDKITSAGVVFPTSIDMKIGKRLGTRHRAAIGISEESDCISIIVSEETGRVSIAINGDLSYNLTLDDARVILLEELQPKAEVEEEEIETHEEAGENNEQDK